MTDPADVSAQLAKLIPEVTAGAPDASVRRALTVLAARAETLAGTRAGRLVAADVWDWAGRARELSPDPAEASTADDALNRSAYWWAASGEPGRAGRARDAVARGRLFRSGVLAPELLRLVNTLWDPRAAAQDRAAALLEIGDLQLRAGDDAEGIRALRQARAALPDTPDAPVPVRVERHLLAYRIDQRLAVTTGDAGLLRGARGHRDAADRLIAAAAGSDMSGPGPLDLLVDQLDEWDVAAHANPGDPRLRDRAENMLTRLAEDPLPNAADIAAAVSRRLADLHLRVGDPEAAARVLRTAVAGVPVRRRHDLGVALLVRLARAEAARGRWPQAERVAAKAIAFIEPLRQSVTGVRPREGYTGERIDAYLVAAEAALRRGDAGQLLTITELVKGRRLARVRVAGGGDPAITASVRALRAAGHEPRLGEDQSPGDLWLRRLAADAWDAAGPYAALPPFRPAELRARLAPGEAVLSYFWLDRTRLVALLLRPDRLWWRELPVTAGTRATLERATTAQPGVDAGSFLSTTGGLGEALLPPSAELDGVRRLYVSPHRLLHALPFAALHLDGVPLLDRMTVVHAPSLAALTRPRLRPGFGELAGVDVADFGAYQGVPDLRRVTAAARATYQRWGDRGRLRLALSDAAVDTVLAHAGDLGRAGVVQLVTHGTDPRPEDAVEPRLALHDGAIDGLDLAMWTLNAPLVLLLACHSGRRAVRGESGEELVADEVNGLAAALFSAGASTVVGALWRAQESFAAALTEALHDRLLAGVPADRALRRAVRDTRDSRPMFRRPYLWAPWTITTTALLPMETMP